MFPWRVVITRFVTRFITRLVTRFCRGSETAVFGFLMSAYRLWNFDGVEDFVQDVLAGHVFRFGFVAQPDTVAHHIETDGTDVFGNYIAAVFDEGIGFGGQGQIDAGTGRCAESNHAFEFVEFVLFRITGGENNVGDVVFDFFIHIDFTGQFPCADDVCT